MDQTVNNILFAWKLTCMLRTYKTYNPIVGFFKYKFNNELLSNIILLRKSTLYIIYCLKIILVFWDIKLLLGYWLNILGVFLEIRNNAKPIFSFAFFFSSFFIFWKISIIFLQFLDPFVEFWDILCKFWSFSLCNGGPWTLIKNIWEKEGS